MNGSCQCGHVTFEVKAPPLALAACFCTECQKVSGGFGTYSMFVPAQAFELLSGEMHQWRRGSDTGSTSIAHFCPHCSNRIFHQDPDIPELLRIKAGNLDNAKSLVPDLYVWMRSAPSWIQPPEGSLCYDTQPTREEAQAAMAARGA
jgi:hypothetical protein